MRSRLIYCGRVSMLNGKKKQVTFNKIISSIIWTNSFEKRKRREISEKIKKI